MSLATSIEMDAKKTGRSVSKSPRRRKDVAVKKGFYLTPENAQRLGLHGVMWRLSDSDIVNRLIEQHLRDFVVHNRARSSQEQVSSTQTDSLDS